MAGRSTFCPKGYAVYIMDQVGRGRSAYVDSAYGPNNPKAPKFVEREFIAYEKYNLFPQAKLHTQWPGPGTVGDPMFDQFQAMMEPDFKDRVVREKFNRPAGVALLDKIGPAILMAHSQAGIYAWGIANDRPNLIKGMIMVEAAGSPFHEVAYKGPPDYFKDEGLSKPWGFTRTPVDFDPPISNPSELALEQQEKPDAPDLFRCWRQKEPARQLVKLKGIPIMLLHAEASFAMPTAHCGAAFLKQSGVDNDFVKLADLGIHGNGHFMMLEKNSLQIAAVIADWLNKQGDAGRSASRQEVESDAVGCQKVEASRQRKRSSRSMRAIAVAAHSLALPIKSEDFLCGRDLEAFEDGARLCHLGCRHDAFGDTHQQDRLDRRPRQPDGPAEDQHFVRALLQYRSFDGLQRELAAQREPGDDFFKPARIRKGGKLIIEPAGPVQGLDQRFCRRIARRRFDFLRMQTVGDFRNGSMNLGIGVRMRGLEFGTHGLRCLCEQLGKQMRRNFRASADAGGKAVFALGTLHQY